MFFMVPKIELAARRYCREPLLIMISFDSLALLFFIFFSKVIPATKFLH